MAASRLSERRHVIDVDVQSLASHRIFCCWHFGDPLEFAHRPQAERA
jgi:hypothetical protein